MRRRRRQRRRRLGVFGVFICIIYVCTNINQHFNFLLRCRLILRCEETTTANACTLSFLNSYNEHDISVSMVLYSNNIIIILCASRSLSFREKCITRWSLFKPHYYYSCSYILRRGGLINTRAPQLYIIQYILSGLFFV